MLTTRQARYGDFYTHLFQTEKSEASLCGLSLSRFMDSNAAKVSLEVATGGRSDVCGRCARSARKQLAATREP